MRYAIVIEKGPAGFGAYVPDLPGCVAVAETESDVRGLIREAIDFHLEGMREDGEPIPEPAARVDYVEGARLPDAPRPDTAVYGSA
jgi:predicted RNase H-like HicB family nuclease